MRATLLSFSLISFVLPAVFAALPKKIYGVNLGSWMVLEPWMLPQEWLDMGGERNCDCGTCIGSEFAFAKAYPDTVDEKFAAHWDSWFNQAEVDALVAAGINTVRIPLGYWIVEPLVRRDTEFFPRGGLEHLRRGLKQLKKAGIVAILDHHALPGAQAENQQFAGRCTPTPEFYTQDNYHRALIWTAVMTTLSHVDPAFANVVAIQAVNEPIMQATKTPDLGTFQKNFVKTLRATEFLLGVHTPGFAPLAAQSSTNFTSLLTDVPETAQFTSLFNAEVRSVLIDTVPVLLKAGIFGLPLNREQLVTNQMDRNWQWGDDVANPADGAIGPSSYDNHLYYVFGGVADANPDAYMRHICNLDRIEKDAVLGNSPLIFGEWGLPTQFSATDEFLMKWADAQKLQYGKDAGWIFWNFKVEISELAGDLAREWSYLEGVRRGYFTKDPSAFHDPNVCVPYLGPAPTTFSAAESSTTAPESTTSAADADPTA
ncbi:glycoside hydrolase family 5 protein [Mycena rebaudengoi]|nr:glycoside hydrolase family 5 protein [Mycena rebaudengoi]